MAVNSIPESDLPFLFSSFLPGVAACLTVPSKGGVGGDPLWEEGEGERWKEEKAIKLVPGKEEEEETGKRRNEMNSFNPPPLPFFLFACLSVCSDCHAASFFLRRLTWQFRIVLYFFPFLV